jgi:ribosomal protein L6P/L9E
MLQNFSFVNLFTTTYLYADKCFYYFCFINKNNKVCLKFSVLRRFLMLFLKKNLLLNFFIFTQYLYSFVSIFKNVCFSLLFPFKKRLKFHGLAFGVEFDQTLRMLSLNVGFASPPIFLVPKLITEIRVSTTQRKVLFESLLLEKVSNFTIQIKNVRPINTYFNPAKRGGRRGIRTYLSVIKRKKFNKDVK